MSILQNNKRYSFADITNTYNKLPPLNFQLRYSEREGYFLEEIEAFRLPEPLWVNTESIPRIARSWQAQTHNMGVLLTGLKGTGKTIMAQALCIELGLPVIMITDEFTGTDFIQFLSNPQIGPAVVFIDEFDKKWGNYNEILPLFDGAYPTRLLFLLTANYPLNSDLLNNRLGRIKYRINFTQLTPKEIQRIAESELRNPQLIPSISEFEDRVGFLSLDLLINLIREMNLHNEDALTVGKWLNVSAQELSYDIEEFWEGQSVSCRTQSVSIQDPHSEIEICRPHNLKHLQTFVTQWPNEKDFDGRPLGASHYVQFKMGDLKIEKTAKGWDLIHPTGLLWRLRRTRDKQLF